MNGIVLDASVLLSWAMSSDKLKVDMARKVIASNLHDLYSHELLKYELSNALVFSIKEKSLVDEVYGSFENLQIVYLKLGANEYRLARDIARTINDSVYDASYHALAITKGMEFVTCDRKYFRKAKNFGFIRLI